MPTASVFSELRTNQNVEGQNLVTRLTPPNNGGPTLDTFTITNGVQTADNDPSKPRPIPANSVMTVTDWTAPDPYVTGGVTITAAQVGLTVLEALVCATCTLPIDGTTTLQISSAAPTKIVISVEDGTSGISAEHAATSATGIKGRIVAIGY